MLMSIRRCDRNSFTQRRDVRVVHRAVDFATLDGLFLEAQILIPLRHSQISPTRPCAYIHTKHAHARRRMQMVPC
jgi:hypothetical protein